MLRSDLTRFDLLAGLWSVCACMPESPGNTDGPGSTGQSSSGPAATSTSSTGAADASTSNDACLFDCPSGNLCQSVNCGQPGGMQPPIFYDEDIVPIWQTHCVMGCHSPNVFVAAAAGLSLLPEDDSWCSLVDRPSISTTPLNLVEPGEPNASYLWHKLAGTQVCPGVDGDGDEMPPGGCPMMLAEDVLDPVTEWICCGAPKTQTDPNGEGCFQGGSTSTSTGGETGGADVTG